MNAPAATGPLSAADFRARVARLADAPDDEAWGDHKLNPGTRDAIVREGLRAAAVLIPVVDHADGATMLLTRRTEKLKSPCPRCLARCRWCWQRDSPCQ